MKTLNKVIRILNGEYGVDIAPPANAFCLGLAGVHFLLLVTFAHLHVNLMIIMNILSIAIYLVGSLKRFSADYNLFAILLCTEVLCHMFLSAICIGWEPGFYLYVIAVVPSAYYISFSARYIQKRQMHVSIATLLALLTFVGMRVITWNYAPLYMITPRADSIFFICNMFGSCAAVVYSMVMLSSAVNDSFSSLKKKNKKLDKLANTDPLTELYNRRGMKKRLETAVEEAKTEGTEFCLILGDIDDFKHLNDTYGHECGDYILVRVAQTIRGLIREDDYVCRWGGEEILILLNNCKKERAVEIAETLRVAICARPFNYENTDVPASMTLGVQEYIPDIPEEDLVKLADMKMYQGKQSGKNCVVGDITPAV